MSQSASPSLQCVSLIGTSTEMIPVEVQEQAGFREDGGAWQKQLGKRCQESTRMGGSSDDRFCWHSCACVDTIWARLSLALVPRPRCFSIASALLQHCFSQGIMAIAVFLRVVFEYIFSQTKDEQESNPIVRMLVCGCRCCLWCLEKVLQFITEYAYASRQHLYLYIIISTYLMAFSHVPRSMWLSLESLSAALQGHLSSSSPSILCRLPWTKWPPLRWAICFASLCRVASWWRDISVVLGMPGPPVQWSLPL